MKLKKLDSLFFLFFAFLCIFFYFLQRPLWLDERLILENIKEKSVISILGPLKNSQAFPRFYLILVKIISEKFNYSNLALRFLPLLFMITAFFVWQKIYKDQFNSKVSYFLGMLSFISSLRLIYYSNEFKPYSLDVLVVGIFSFYLIRQRNFLVKNPKLFKFITLILPFSIFFSYASFFVILLVPISLILLKDKKLLYINLIYTFLTFLFLSFVFYFDLQYSFREKGLIDYWNDYFLCTKNFYCFFKSFGEGLRKLVVWWFSDSGISRKIASFFIPFFVISLFGYGFTSIKKLKINLESIGFIIFLELFIFGILKKYPFSGERITLFFAPFVFYFILRSFEGFKKIKSIYLALNIFYFCFIFSCLARSLILLFFNIR
ncbi:MAG: hypothetical protein QXZ20_01825 [Candidatus Aenigmatarchaeota archaeon]